MSISAPKQGGRDEFEYNLVMGHEISEEEVRNNLQRLRESVRLAREALVDPEEHTGFTRGLFVGVLGIGLNARVSTLCGALEKVEYLAEHPSVPDMSPAALVRMAQLVEECHADAQICLDLYGKSHARITLEHLASSLRLQKRVLEKRAKLLEQRGKST